MRERAITLTFALHNDYEVRLYIQAAPFGGERAPVDFAVQAAALVPNTVLANSIFAPYTGVRTGWRSEGGGAHYAGPVGRKGLDPGAALDAPAHHNFLLPPRSHPQN